MILTDKIAVIYGAAGAFGAAMARAFVREGARVFLAGRTLSKLEVLSTQLGGRAELARVDALDEAGVERHLAAVVESAGRVDISINAIGVPNAGLLGVPLAQLERAQFEEAVTTYLSSYFLTARHAARHMVKQRSGVIMTVTALHSRIGLPLVVTACR